MSGLLIPHLSGEPRKGTWWLIGNRLFWGCPKCSQGHELTTHTVNDDGEVDPSVVCGKCDFHEFVTLDECSEEARIATDRGGPA